MVIEVDLEGSLTYNWFKMLFENVFKVIGVIKERVIGEIYRRNGLGGNIFSLISKAFSAAKL